MAAHCAFAASPTLESGSVTVQVSNQVLAHPEYYTTSLQ